MVHYEKDFPLESSVTLVSYSITLVVGKLQNILYHISNIKFKVFVMYPGTIIMCTYTCINNYLKKHEAT